MLRLLLPAVVLAALLLPSLSPLDAQEKKAQPRKRGNPNLAQIQDDPTLPRVLLLGDSISIAYTVGVRQALAGKANVHRPGNNCQSTKHGLAELDQWLAVGGKDKSWDVIHFNWGLHDLKYLGPNGENLQDPNDPKNHQQVAPDQYRQNLTRLVERLQATGARLIWRNTTPVPEGAKGRVVGDAAAYNAIANDIMDAAGVPVHDLFAMVKNDFGPEHLRVADVHYTPAGSQLFAHDVARVIGEALAE